MTVPSPSKAARILRRTLTGGTLILAVAGLLSWTSQSEDGRPILYAGAAILIVALWETSRMGTFAMRDLLPPLLVPAVGWLWKRARRKEPSLPE